MAGTQSPSLNAPFTPDAAVFCKPGECQKLWTALQNGGKRREFGNWFQQSTQKLSEKVLNGNLSGKDVTVFVNYMCLSGKIVRAVSKASKDVNVQISAAYSFAVDTERENGSDELAMGCSYPGQPFPCGIVEANLLSDVMANNHLLTERDAFIRIQEKSVTRGQCFVSATQRRRAHAKRNEHAPNIDNFSDRFSARSQSSVVVNRGDSTATRRCLTAKRTRSDDRVENEMELHSTESRDVEGSKETILNGHDFYERVKRIKQETGLEADLQDSEAHYMVVTEGNEGRPEEDDGETSSLEDNQAMDGSESCLSETEAFMHTASVNHSANDSEEMGANSSGGEDNFSGRDVTPETSGMGQCDLNTEADFTESAGPSPLSATMKTPEGAVEDDVEPPSPNPANEWQSTIIAPLPIIVPRPRSITAPLPVKLITPTSSPVKKRSKYKSYTLKQRKEIIEKAKVNGFNATARLHDIPVSTIIYWKKHDCNNNQYTSGGRVVGGGRKMTCSVEMEESILQWILQQRDLQIPVTIDKICTHALQIIKPEHKDFKASNGWCRQFMKRHELYLCRKTSVSQKLPGNLEQLIATFHNYILTIRLEKDFDVIGNMDEMPIYFDPDRKKTVEKSGNKTLRVRTSGTKSRHLTLVLAVAATGEVLPPMIIFKGNKKMQLKHPPGFVVAVHPKGLMDENLMARWVEEIWVPYTERRYSMLVLDSFRAHEAEGIKSKIYQANSVMAVIPGGCNTKLQPFDVVLNKPFKADIQRSLTSYIQQATQKSLTNINPQTIVNWVTSAWHEMKSNPVMVAKSFKICGISNALDGSEANLTRNEQVISHMLADVSLTDDDNNKEAWFESFTSDV